MEIGKAKEYATSAAYATGAACMMANGLIVLTQVAKLAIKVFSSFNTASSPPVNPLVVFAAVVGSIYIMKSAGFIAGALVVKAMQPFYFNYGMDVSFHYKWTLFVPALQLYTRRNDNGSNP